MLKVVLVKHSRKLFRYEIEAAIKAQGNDITGDSVMRLLFDEYGEGRSEYVVKYRYPEKCNTKVIHRINTLWVYPLFFLVAPLRYVMFGEYKVQENSFGEKVLRFLLGELH